MRKTLYFFTASFPFNSGENFIENEMPYLLGAFDKIVIIPLFSATKNMSMVLPVNCSVLKPIIKNKFQHYLIGLLGFKSIPLYFAEFFREKVYTKQKWVINFLKDYCTTNVILQNTELSRILKNVTSNDIMYFYWGKGMSNLLPFVNHISGKKIVRFHGFDLYNDTNGGYIPLQKKIIEFSDQLVFISKHGQNYLHSRYPNILSKKSVVSYLGTSDFGISSKSHDGVFRLVSCSYVTPVKRVEHIFEALQRISDYSIEWTHIGNGTEFEDLIQMAKKTRSNIRIKLLGKLSNQNVFKYYKANHVDAFINVSSSEGLPVSIMEAISFNIPVIATNVGGTSEIVTDKTGILLDENPSISDIAESIKKLHKNSLYPRLFWEDKFNAETNYKNFINLVLSIC